MPIRSPPQVAVAAQSAAVNGDPASTQLQRVLNELRAGRWIAIRSPSETLVAGALETLSPNRIADLAEAGGTALTLTLTGERLRAVGLQTTAEHESFRLHAPLDIQGLAQLGGLGSGRDDAERLSRLERLSPAVMAATSGNGTPVDARAVLLAMLKQSGLVPALVSARFPGALPEDVLSVAATTMARSLAAIGNTLVEIARTTVPLAAHPDCELVLFRDELAYAEHVAVIIGRPDRERAIPVRLHSSCFTGDLLASLRCDCGEQLSAAIERIAATGGGVLLYVMQEGRGIGLTNKLRAYGLQDGGHDTLDANQLLGFRVDERTYQPAIAMLRALDIRAVKLLTNNPRKIAALREAGFAVEQRLPLIFDANPHNARYLATKRERDGHLGAEDD